MVRLALHFALASCTGRGGHGVGPKDGDADTDADADADTDSDTDTDSDSDTDAPPLDELSLAEVALLRTPELDPSESAQFFATFFRVVAPADSDVVFPEPAPDDCASITYTVADLGTAASVVTLSAGTVALTGAVSTGDLLPDPDLAGAYFADLDAASFPYGTSLTVEATGAEFPAFSTSLQVPPDLVLRAPTSGFAPGTGLELRWSGGDPDVPVAAVFTSDWYDDRWYTRCTLTNDGSFDVPPGHLDDLRPGTRVSLQFGQTVQRQLDLDTDPLALLGTVRTLIHGTAP